MCVLVLCEYDTKFNILLDKNQTVKKIMKSNTKSLMIELLFVLYEFIPCANQYITNDQFIPCANQIN